MFEWNVQDYALMKETKTVKDYVARDYTAKSDYIYKCEGETSEADKKEYIDSITDGKLSYILSVAEKYAADVDSLERQANGAIRTAALKAWVADNDPQKLFDVKSGTITIKTSVCSKKESPFCERYIDKLNEMNSYSTHEQFIDECFHRAMKANCRKEIQHFDENDEYTVLKKKANYAVRKYGSFNSNLYLYQSELKVVSETGEKRELTLDELKAICKKSDMIQEYISSISDNPVKF